MVQTKLTIELLPKQDEFIFSPAKYTAYVAGLGAGKTYAGCIKALLRARRGEPGIIIAPTYPMLRDVTQKTFVELLEDGGQEYELNKSEGRVTYCGADILLRSADMPERLRGININWAYLDEAALMRESVWKIILGRLRQGERPAAWITTTPAGFNWVYENWVQRSDTGYAMINASTRENVYLPDEYVEDLESNYAGEYAKQEIDGDFVAFEGLVYDGFMRNTHIRQFDVKDGWQQVRAIDYGYTNPFVCLWGALDEDNRLYVYDEHYQRKTLIKDHARIIKERDGTYAWTVADHDAQDNAEMRAEGIPTVNAKKDVIVGIQKVQSRLREQHDGRPRLLIHPRCVNVIKEFGMYRWSEKNTGRNEKEEPVKENDHAMDALRYMVMQIDRGGVYLV